MTVNHDYNTPDKDTTDWHIPINENFEALDTDVPVRDTEDNRDAYTPKQGATYIATDTGAVYDGDGTTWVPADRVYNDVEAVNSITFPDGTTFTTSPNATLPDIEEDGGVVQADASALNFVESNAASVSVSADGDDSVTIDISATDTNTQRTNEEVRDVVGTFVTGGTNVTATHDDANDTLTISGLSDSEIRDVVGAMAGNNITYDAGAQEFNANNTQLTQEQVEDYVDQLIVAENNITKGYDDAGDTLTLSGLTDAQIKSLVGTMAGSNITYDAQNDELDAQNTQLTTEQVQDIVGAFVIGGTNTTVDYDDQANTLTINASGGTTTTDEDIQDAVGTILDSSLYYDDSTPSIGIASSGVTMSHLNFDPATQTELDTHVSNGSAHHTRYTDEEVRDVIGAALVDSGNITISVSDTQDSITISTDALDAEQVRDEVGALLGSDATIDIVVDDAGDSITISIPDDGVTAAQIAASAVNSSHISADSVGLSELASPFPMPDITDMDVGNTDLTDGSTVIWNASGGPNNQGELSARVNTSFANINRLYLPDIGSNPSVGEFRRNGNDVLVHSGGSIRNLSNIGSGGSGGAPTDASYLTLTSETGLSNETVVSTYPFSITDLDTPFVLSSLTNLDLGGNDLTDGGSIVWDTSSNEVPQQNLGGPAQGLSSYPLSSADYGSASINTTHIENGTILEEDLDPSVPLGGYAQVAATSDYTAGSLESVWADASTQNVTITLPSPSKSSRVRVLATDATNTVTLSESGSEQIQTSQGAVSSLTLSEGESVEVESNGSTWWVIGDLGAIVDTGTLGTMPVTTEYQTFTINNVSENEDQQIGSVAVYPTNSIAEDYSYEIDVLRVWDNTNGHLDLDVAVTWYTQPSAALDLDYTVFEGTGGSAGGTGTNGGTQMETVGPITASQNPYTSATWDETVLVDASSGDVSVELPDPQNAGMFIVKKITEVGTATLDTPGTETIDGQSAIALTADTRQSRTVVSDGSNYYIV